MERRAVILLLAAVLLAAPALAAESGGHAARLEAYSIACPSNRTEQVYEKYVEVVDSWLDACPQEEDATSCSSSCKDATLELVSSSCYWRWVEEHQDKLAVIKTYRALCTGVNWEYLAYTALWSFFGAVLLLWLIGLGAASTRARMSSRARKLASD
eukprot:PLAT12327.5.p2 GENE.PLAT12327.5~~PLAT12327.5.p2  ORF type:complete len:167 (+),score=54.19 PLAT12327.5:35-502(+)